MDESARFAHFPEYRGNLFRLYVCTVTIGNKYENNYLKCKYFVLGVLLRLISNTTLIIH